MIKIYYNMTNITSADNIVITMQQVNIASGFIFGFMILIAIAVILIVSFKNYGIRTIMPIVAFLCTIIGVFLAIMQLIPDFIVYILIVATSGLVLASIFINPEG